MDSKVTSTKRRSGFTTIELLFSVGIASVLMIATAALMSYTGRSFAAMANYADLDRMSRNALDTMTQEIRQANKLLEGSTNRLVFQDFDGANLVYFYSADARTLTRTKNGATKILLKNCDQLIFSLFQRNPIGGSYDVYPSATAATCKLVQLRWTCSRDLIRSKVNTESVQSSKIVIRRQ